MAAGFENDIRVKGLGLSKGCVVGKVCMFNENRHSNLPMYKVEGEGLEREKARVARACEIADARLEEIRQKVEEDMGKAESEIFVAQKLILHDQSLIDEINGYIVDRSVNAESAVEYVLRRQEKRLAEIDNEYISARASDIGELKARLLDVLVNMRPSLQCHPDKCERGRNRIVVAEELTPSLTVELDRELTIGFVAERGGINSHAAILARAMGIPAVGNVQGIREKVGCGAELLLNGETGEVVIWPTENTVNKAMAEYSVELGTPEPIPPVENLKVLANIGLPSDIELCEKMQAEGVGLYRTEFELLAAGRFLSEDELYERYLKVRQSIALDKKVVYRLFDIGTDKQLPFMSIPEEENPSLGWRGSRLLLDNDDLYRAQARALARVSRTGQVHVMYPMIVDLDQFLAMRGKFEEFTDDIDKGEILHGVMFEVPSACLQARELFTEIDFGSVGSNDLTQYLFAIDRENENLSASYNPDHPIFWRLIGDIAKVAKSAGKSLSICGELGGEPAFTKRILDLGIDEVSVSPRLIPIVRNAAEK